VAIQTMLIANDRRLGTPLPPQLPKHMSAYLIAKINLSISIFSIKCFFKHVS